MGRPLNVWRLGDGGPEVDRLLLATLPCPIARTDATERSNRFAAEELTAALVALGHVEGDGAVAPGREVDIAADIEARMRLADQILDRAR